MIREQLFITVVFTSFILSGCGTSNATNDSIDNNFTILEGTVPGTLIEAYCIDGSYYKVNSTQNSSTKHPFTLSIPKNLNCHLVMITNEDDPTTKVITPISIVTQEGSGSLFYGKSDKVNLSHIPLALNRDDIIDRTGDGVSDKLLEVEVFSGTLVTVQSANDPMDDDEDGIINIYEDDDEDGIYNDEDDDHIHENDSDGDGIDDDDDIDDDNDGIKDEDEEDEKDEEDEEESDDES